MKRQVTPSIESLEGKNLLSSVSLGLFGGIGAGARSAWNRCRPRW